MGYCTVCNFSYQGIPKFKIKSVSLKDYYTPKNKKTQADFAWEGVRTVIVP